MTNDIDSQHFLDFCVIEVTHTTGFIELKTEDIERVKKMDKEQLREHIEDQMMDDWSRGKEYVEDNQGLTGEVRITRNGMDAILVIDDMDEEPPEDTTANRMTLYEQLHDGLSDMVESGRLSEASVPEDYRWLVETLAKASGDRPEQPELKYVDMAADIKVKFPTSMDETPEAIKTGNLLISPIITDGETQQRLHTFKGKDQRPTLEECQEFVEGPIAIITIRDDGVCPIGSQLIVNEEAAMTGMEPLPVNRMATRIFLASGVTSVTGQIYGHCVLLVDGAQLT